MTTRSEPLQLDLEQWCDGGRPSVAVVIRFEGCRQPTSSEWRPGPLPVVQPRTSAAISRGHAPTTDAAARRTLVAPQQADALYGQAGLVRIHRLCRQGQLVALELLLERRGQHDGAEIAFVVAHLAVAPSADAVKAVIDTLGPPGREQEQTWWSAIVDGLGGPGPWSRVGRARTMTFIDAGNRALVEPRSDALLRGYAALSRPEGDRWRELAPRAERHQLTIARPDWSALVLRDGAAYVAHGAADTEFAPSLRVLVHTVHTDALLLALVQRAMLDRSGDRAVTASLSDAGELVALESAHFEFRRTYWRTSLTDKRTAPPDVVLHAFQEELLTTADIVDVERRVSDGARLATSLSARAQQQAQERLNAMVQDGSVVIGGYALAFTAAPVVTDPSWHLFFTAFGVATLGVVAVLVALRLVGAGRSGGARSEKEQR